MSLRKQFLNYIAQTSEDPLMLEITASEGLYLIDSAGNRYMDLISGISVSILGHNHPQIVEAVKSQADQYMHTMVYGEFVLSPQVEYAQKLTSFLPSQLQTVYYANSGSEAVEGAIKLAKRYTGRSNIVAMKNAYHGSTSGAMSLNSDSYFTAAYRPLLPNIQHLDFNNIAQLNQINESTAAVIVEPVQAENGIRTPQNDYLKQLRERCSKVGALLVFDEIQTGMGRTGHLFAFQKYEVLPDVLLLAKAFGGGMPLGAFISSQDIMRSLSHNPVLGHITTFGGHPVSCAAGLACFNEIVDKGLFEEVAKKEKYLIQRLKHDAIKEVRSAGLWCAIDLGSAEKVMQVVKRGLQDGFIIDWFLFNSESLRFAPPLTISYEELDQAIGMILMALDEL